MDYAITPSLNTENNCWDVILSGEFDIFNSSEMKNSLNELTGEKNLNLHLDFGSVTFIDSTALGALVAVLKNVKTYGGSVIVENLKPNLLKLFKITNLDRVFEIAGDSDGK